MASSSSKKDALDMLSSFLAQNKGLPIFVGIGLCAISLILNCIPGLENNVGLGGWLVRSDLLLHLGVIVGLVGILLGDAL